MLQHASQAKIIEDLNADKTKLHSEIQKLNGLIKSLDKDISGLKKEIQERDETIQDKVLCKMNEIVNRNEWKRPFCTGKAYLRLEKEEPGAGEVQVCAGLQDQRVEESDRAERDSNKGEERTDPTDGV